MDILNFTALCLAGIATVVDRHEVFWGASVGMSV